MSLSDWFLMNSRVYLFLRNSLAPQSITLSIGKSKASELVRRASTAFLKSTGTTYNPLRDEMKMRNGNAVFQLVKQQPRMPFLIYKCVECNGPMSADPALSFIDKYFFHIKRNENTVGMRFVWVVADSIDIQESDSVLKVRVSCY